MNTNNKQKGITLVEFTIVGSTVLLIIFAILELGVFLFNLQSINDLTRRTARIAAVCQVNDPEIKELALSEREPQGLTSGNIVIDYLDKNGGSVFDPTNNYDDIYYVSARVENYNYGFSGVLNFLGDNGVITTPEFETILAAESLGVERLSSDGEERYTDCKK